MESQEEPTQTTKDVSFSDGGAITTVSDHYYNDGKKYRPTMLQKPAFEGN